MTNHPQPSSASHLSDEALDAALTAGRDLIDAPAHLVARADAIWRPRPAKSAHAGRLSGLRRLLAALSHDTAAGPATALGLRGAGTGPRQLMFSVDGIGVDLRITDDDEPGRTWLHGQVFAPGEGGAVWMESETGLRSMTVDAFGEFRAGPLEPGRYRVAVERDDWVVELPPLALPEGRTGAADDVSG